jgi:hypothetical protein
MEMLFFKADGYQRQTPIVGGLPLSGFVGHVLLNPV